MASMKFIVENDVPVTLSCEGSAFDIIALVGYLIGNIYRMLRSRNPGHAAAFRKCLNLVVSDPKSPMWSIDMKEGMTDVVMVVPKGKADDDRGADNLT